MEIFSKSSYFLKTVRHLRFPSQIRIQSINVSQKASQPNATECCYSNILDKGVRDIKGDQLAFDNYTFDKMPF
jgi:hypothetical protein